MSKSASSRAVQLRRNETLMVYASKDGNRISTTFTSPTLTVAKANSLYKSGWDVQIVDSYDRRYGPRRFHEILSFDRRPPIRF